GAAPVRRVAHEDRSEGARMGPARPVGAAGSSRADATQGTLAALAAFHASLVLTDHYSPAPTHCSRPRASACGNCPSIREGLRRLDRLARAEREGRSARRMDCAPPAGGRFDGRWLVDKQIGWADQTESAARGVRSL